MRPLRPALALTAVFVLAALAACADDPAAVPPTSPATRLEGDTGVTWVLEMDPATNTVRWAFPKSPTPPILAAGADPFATAAAFLSKYPETFGVRAAADLNQRETSTDADGVTHVSFTQVVGGAPADFARLDIHFFADGSVSHVSGPFYPTLDQISRQAPAIGEATAKQNAVQGAAAFGAPNVVAKGARVEVALDDHGAPLLEYFVELTADGEPLTAEIDAMTGSYRRVLRDHRTLRASGIGYKGGRRETFDIDDRPAGAANYEMKRSRQNNRPEVAIYDHTTSTLVASPDKDDWEQNMPAHAKGVAVDCMAKFQGVEAWYRSKFGYVSFDNRGAPIQVYVYQPGGDSTNAYYAGGRGPNDPRGREFGFEVSTSADAYTQIDVIAHEFTHGVNAHNGNLLYGGESGALDESIADIFGQLIERDVRPGSGSSALVADEYGTPIRSLRDPRSVCPDCADHVDQSPDVLARLSRFGSYDNGGVHLLSGIPNLAWYMMTFGSSHPRGTRIPGPALGVDNSRAVSWDLVRHELHRYASFRDAAKATLLIARYKRIERRAIGCAWNAVGVLGADELRTNYDIDCAGEADAGDDLCRGKGTTAFCHPTLPRSAVLCVEGAFVGIDECDDGADAGPICSSATFELPDGGGKPTVTALCSPSTYDSCDGKADGYYCSEMSGSEYASYYCEGGVHAGGGKFCPSNSHCVGFDPSNEIQCAANDGG